MPPIGGVGGYPAQQPAAHYPATVPAQQTQPQQPVAMGGAVARAPRSRGESKIPSDVFDGSYSEPQLGVSVGC